MFGIKPNANKHFSTVYVIVRTIWFKIISIFYLVLGDFKNCNHCYFSDFEQVLSYKK